MSAYSSKYHIGLDQFGYVLSQNRNGVRYYQKKKAPSFVNKFGGGDSAYRDSTFWQFFVQTDWRNGAKQLKFDDPGKFWKSSDVDTTILEQLSLSKTFVSAGQIAAGVKVNCMEAWRASTSWWNANYGYRQQLTVTAPVGVTVPSGYPVKVSIDTAALQTASKVRSDRKDWRVVYFNGSSWVDLTRDYIDSTTTFFPLQEAIASGATSTKYYVYYGYSSESTTKQPSTEADWNTVYSMYGATPDANTVLVAHFREGSGGSINDDSSSSNTGTLTNGSWGTDGRLGRYAVLNGSNAAVDFGSGSNLNLGSMTLEGWIYPTSSPQPSNEGQIFFKAESGSSLSAFAFGMNGNNKLYFGHSSDGGGGGLRGVNAISINTWHHVAATYDGTTAKLYIDGVIDTQGSVDPITDSSGKSLKMASNGSSNGAWGGRVQHMRVSNTARTSFPYALSSDPSVTAGSETTTQPPSTSFDLYAGGSDGVVYKWDGTTSWASQFDARRIEWYEQGVDAGKIIGDTGGVETAQSQGFEVSGNVTVSGAAFYLKKNAGTPGDITVRIETDSTGKPSGTLADANATGTITAFTTASYGWVEVTFAGTVALNTGTQYHLVLKTAAAANDNNYAIAADTTSPTYSNGAMSVSTDGGSTWTAVSGSDAYFRLLGQATQINCMRVSSLSDQKLYLGTGDPAGQTNGDARLYSFDGTNWALVKIFATTTEAMINSIEEYSANSKAYIGIGPQAKIYETADFASFTLSKDINNPQNPGYVYAMKEYNRVLHAGGGSPEFLPSQYYNGFVNTYDTTTWNALYPFDFTVIRSLEFYDAYLFMGTYHGQLYVYDTSTLNPLFSFKEQYDYKAEIKTMKYFDDKLYIGLYPQENSNETNIGIWIFDRRGLSLAHTIAGVTGYRCFAVVNGTLFVGTGDDGYIYKLNTEQYVTTGWVQSSYFDANLPSIDKLYNTVTIRHNPLANGQSIQVYYRFKEEDDWTYLGLSNTVGGIEQVLSFPTGTSSKKITLKTVLNTTDTSATPVLTEQIMQYSLYPTRKWQWTFRIKAKKNLRLLDGTLETRTAEEIRADIEALYADQKLYRFVDVDGTAYNVLLNDLDTQSWVVNQDDVNEEEIALTLLEA